MRFRQLALSLGWSLLFWISFAVMLAGEDRVRLAQRNIHTGYWTLVLVDSAWCVTFALLTPSIFYVVEKYPVTKQTRLRRTTAYLLGTIPFMLVFACMRWLILPPWNSVLQQFVPRSFHNLVSITYGFADQTWTYLATVITAHAFTYHSRARKEETERLEAQQALATSELQALKSQIHPHFLFNTLQGISTLVDSDGNKAKRMIVMLSNLLRTALQHGQTDLIPLHEELIFIEDYLAIEKVRLEDRLEVRWDVPTATRTLLVPQLILQPLVENAIVHGIACCREGGWIHIIARKKEHCLEIQIINSMCGEQPGGMGVGMQNIRSRLKHLYADEAEFAFKNEDNQLATATLTLPRFESPQASPDLGELEHASVPEESYERPDRR